MGNETSKEWGEGHPQCSVDFVMKNAQPGDIILFHGVGGASDLIRGTSIAQNWSHVGVILPVAGELAITEAYRTIISRDVIRDDLHTGVQTVPLKQRLLTYEGGKVAWRPIRHIDGKKVPLHIIDKFIRRLLSYREMPAYCSNIIDFFEYGTRTDNDKDISAGGKEFYVCTSWTATAWRDFGIYQKYYYDTGTGAREERNPGRLTLADVGMHQPTVPFTEGWGAWDIHFIQQSL